jgi:hypothetical protein
MSSIIVMDFYVLTTSILFLVLLVLVDYIRILRLRSKMPPGPLPLVREIGVCAPIYK